VSRLPADEEDRRKAPRRACGGEGFDKSTPFAEFDGRPDERRPGN